MTKFLFTKTLRHSLLTIFILCDIISRASFIYVKGSESTGRIVNGSITNINSAKFTVNLRVNGKFICGGSLITPEIVVTAAHCVKGVSPGRLTVVGGATYLSESGVRRSVDKIITPKEYNAKTYHFDIAVLKLTGKMIGNNIETIELCKDDWKLGDYINVFGWGALNENSNKESNQLRTVRVPLVTRKRCSDMYKVDGSRISNTMFCAGDLKGKDACFGDSGGPAVFHNQLCGVVSWGMGCARRNFPGVYTSIKTVRQFIEKAMKL
ncbi:trypsin delta/gamma-like protein CG30031 [Cochliomyia hominivorax]